MDTSAEAELLFQGNSFFDAVDEMVGDAGRHPDGRPIEIGRELNSLHSSRDDECSIERRIDR